MKYRHLTEEERYHIYELKSEGFTQIAIAGCIGYSRSTISRELSRNRGERGYRPRQANLKATERLSIRGKSNVKRASESAWEYAKLQLVNEQWSPEQIAGRLVHDKQETISHETIYKKILVDKQSGGRLHIHLRCQKKRKKRYGSARSNRGTIKNRVDIDERPAIVNERKRVGDWEGDTIIGSHKKGAVIASMVERKSRFTKLAKSKDKTSKNVISSINQCMGFTKSLVFTITLDNGKEFGLHDKLSTVLGAKVFFAKPYHSWERGLNENTNGLVRQYFPKKSSFDRITPAELQQVEDKLNNRPRKCLGFKTPFEIFNRDTKKQFVALRI